MGALGSAVADQLARAGVGLLRIVDRDVVELTNLQRQTLYEEVDAHRNLPKVEAAARRLTAIRSDLVIEPHALDVDAANIEPLLDGIDLIIDGSDNAELRYLINDAAVRHRLPWVMGGAIGVEGRVAGFRTRGPCLRCVFPTPPAPGELMTCDTAGALGPTIGVVASLQVVEAMKLLLADPSAASVLHTMDLWAGRHRAIDLRAAQRSDCRCCGERKFDFLDRPATGGAKLCGRSAVQVRPPTSTRIDLASLASRLAPIAKVEATSLMLKLMLHERPEQWMSVFGDGRAIVFGTADLAVARSLYARVIGA